MSKGGSVFDFEEFKGKVEKLKVFRTGGDLGLLEFNVLFLENSIVSWNGFFLVSVPCSTGIVGCVYGKPLCDLVSVVSGKRVKLVQHGDHVNVRVDRKVEADLALLDFDLGEVRSIVRGRRSWQDVPGGFEEGMRLCFPVMSQDPTAGFLYCLCVDGDRLVSSDNYRIMICDLDFPFPKGKFLLSRDVVSYLIKFGGYESFDFGDKSWAAFRLEDGTELFCRLVTEDFPRVDQFFDFDGENVDFTSEFREGLIAGSAFCDGGSGEDARISVSVKDHRFLCRGGSDKGRVIYESRLDFDGSFSFSLEAGLLDKVLGVTDRLCVGRDRILLVGEGFRCLVLLAEE